MPVTRLLFGAYAVETEARILLLKSSCAAAPDSMNCEDPVH